MSRRNVKVEVPVGSPDDFVELVETLLKKHRELGDASPLKLLDMATLEDRLSEAESKRNESKQLRGQSERKMQESLYSLGLSKGQTIDTPGTVYNLLTQSRDLLLSLNKGKETALNEYGFKVVISSSTVGRRKKDEGK